MLYVAKHEVVSKYNRVWIADTDDWSEDSLTKFCSVLLGYLPLNFLDSKGTNITTIEAKLAEECINPQAVLNSLQVTVLPNGETVRCYIASDRFNNHERYNYTDVTDVLGFAFSTVLRYNLIRGFYCSYSDIQEEFEAQLNHRIWADGSCCRVKVLTKQDLEDVQRVQHKLMRDTLIHKFSGIGNSAICLACMPDVVIMRSIDLSGSNSHITVPEGVTHIEASAFEFQSIESVTLPESLTHIDWYAFSNALSLRELFIPPSVKYVGQAAFYMDSQLKEVHFSKQITDAEIDYHAFRGWSGTVFMSKELLKKNGFDKPFDYPAHEEQPSVYNMYLGEAKEVIFRTYSD